MSRFAIGLLTSAVLVTACSDSTTVPLEAPGLSAALGTSVMVTTAADDGPGSLRAALAAASVDPGLGLIRVGPGLGTIALQSPLVYGGSHPLRIHGAGVVLDGSGLGAGESVFVADGGGDLVLTDLTATDAPAYGILVIVPEAAQGVLRVELDRVVVRGNGLHGVLVNDQTEYLTDPDSESEAGSDAGIELRVTAAWVDDNGNAALDYDGLRVNEGGPGDIVAVIQGSRFTGNGADGVELDERGPGSARFAIQQSDLLENGAFSTEDLDDGIDVDEAGEGDIVAEFVQVRANHNSEQGVDLNENGPGDLRVTMHQVEGSGNGEEGIEFEEDDDVAGGGDLVADLTGVTTNGNGLADDGDAGLKLREKGDGRLEARLVNIAALANLIGGVELREDAGGDLDARLQSVTANDNAGRGVRLRGTGSAVLRAVTATGNAAQNLQADAGIVVDAKP